MYKILYPYKDASIYEKYPDRNAGIDQIIEITKLAAGEEAPDVISELSTWDNTYNSRILMQFDLTGLNYTSSIAAYLILKATETSALPIEYTLHSKPLSESWINGNGNLNDSPEVTNGVSWEYRTSAFASSSWNPNSGSMVYSMVSGGGNWNNNYIASQSFMYQSPDVRMDVTNIVKAWLSGSISNNGFVIKHTDANELNNEIFGSLKFFSKDTHTIYIPRLEILWDESSYTGSFVSNDLIGDEYTIFLKNLKESYKESESFKLRFGARDKYPIKTYATSSNVIIEKRLPATTYYSIVDEVTNEAIVPFDTSYTKISMDDDGHYFKLDLTNFLPERYYRILFKIENNGDSIIYDNKFNFRVTRR